VSRPSVLTLGPMRLGADPAPSSSVQGAVVEEEEVPLGGNAASPSPHPKHRLYALGL
jgi:hypothetical protein